MLELEKNGMSLRVSERGATVMEWKVGEVDVLFPEDNEYLVDGAHKRRGGIPICFPNFGPAPVGTELRQHGFLRDTEMLAVTEGFRLEAAEETLAVYPYPFRVEVEVSLQGVNRLRHWMRIKNTALDGPEMPIGHGLHPYFRTPGGGAVIKWDDGNPLRFRGPSNDAIFGHAESGTVEIKIPGLGIVRVEAIGYNFPGLDGVSFAVWSDTAEYVCIEPITSLPGEMERGLLPGEEREFWCNLWFWPEV